MDVTQLIAGSTTASYHFAVLAGLLLLSVEFRRPGWIWPGISGGVLLLSAGYYLWQVTGLSTGWTVLAVTLASLEIHRRHWSKAAVATAGLAFGCGCWLLYTAAEPEWLTVTLCASSCFVYAYIAWALRAGCVARTAKLRDM